MKLLLVMTSVAAVLLAGCASQAEITAADSAHCDRFGYPPGSVSHAQCMQKIDTERRRSADAAFNAMNASMAAKSPTHVSQCSSSGSGSSTTTGTSTSTTVGVPGNSTTTGSSSSTTSSSSSGFTMCLGN